ncbi:MAG: hemerythrin domain-containing protein [Thermoplasmata archaeon]
MLSEIFTDQHWKIDLLLGEFIKSLKENDQGVEELAELRKLLRSHIYLEESVIYPLVETNENHNGINGLEVEHAGIFRLLDKIQLYIARNDYVRATDRAEGLVRVLAAHNGKEVQTVYSVLDALPESEQAGIIDRIKQLGVPENWECKVLIRYSRRRST